jgi:uncharacterized protein (DUF952 family)
MTARAPSDPVVYKICPRADWLRARELGELGPSNDDARDGYIHLSRTDQVAGTLAKHFAGRVDLLLLAVRVERLPEQALRYEISRGGEAFPHLYGALSIAWVQEVIELPLDARGQHVLPEGF